jgi:spore coat protein U-like protein
MPRGQIGHAIRALCAVLALALSALLSTPAQAQRVTAQARADAVVVTPLSLVKVEDLNFGRIAARTTAGTVTINVNTGACTITGGLIHQGACQFAEFAGMGARRMTVRFQIPTTVTLTGPAGATMLVDTMTLGTQPGLTLLGGNGNGLGNGNRRYSIDANSGIFTFRVAGRLNVGANQRAGVYTGSFPVTVQYQ